MCRFALNLANCGRFMLAQLRWYFWHFSGVLLSELAKKSTTLVEAFYLIINPLRTHVRTNARLCVRNIRVDIYMRANARTLVKNCDASAQLAVRLCGEVKSLVPTSFWTLFHTNATALCIGQACSCSYLYYLSKYLPRRTILAMANPHNRHSR